MKIGIALILVAGTLQALPASADSAIPPIREHDLHRDLAMFRIDTQISLDALPRQSPGVVIWERKFKKEGTRYVRFQFTQIAIPAQADFELQVLSDPVGKLVASHTAAELARSDTFTTGLLPSGQLRVRILARELQRPASMKLDHIYWQAESTFLIPQTAIPSDEPVATLRADHPARRLARSVAMLHIGPLGVTCTSFIVGTDLLVTNYHCIEKSLKFLTTETQPRPVCNDVIAEFDYLRKDLEGPSATCVEVVRADSAQDIALLRLPIPPAKDGGIRQPISAGTAAIDSDRLMLLHHPLGKPLMFDEHCRTRGATETEILHDCDTSSGSSGSALLSEVGALVGLHFRGAYDSDWTIEQIEKDEMRNGRRYNHARPAKSLAYSP